VITLPAAAGAPATLAVARLSCTGPPAVAVCVRAMLTTFCAAAALARAMAVAAAVSACAAPGSCSPPPAASGGPCASGGRYGVSTGGGPYSPPPAYLPIRSDTRMGPQGLPPPARVGGVKGRRRPPGGPNSLPLNPTGGLTTPPNMGLPSPPPTVTGGLAMPTGPPHMFLRGGRGGRPIGPLTGIGGNTMPIGPPKTPGGPIGPIGLSPPTGVPTGPLGVVGGGLTPPIGPGPG